MSKVDELLEQIKTDSTFQSRIQALQEIAKHLEPTDTEAIQLIQQVANYNLYTGLAPYAKKVLDFLKKKYPEFHVQSVQTNPKIKEELKALRSDDFRERLRVLEYFECEGITDVAPHLLKMLKEEQHPWVVSKLTKTTGLLGAPHDNEYILDSLIPFLNHEDDRIRANTIEGIGGLQSIRKIPLLLDMMLKDESERVKQMASIALSFDDTVKVLELVRIMLDGDDLELADKALEVLKRFDWVEASNMYEDYRERVYQRKEAAAFEASISGMDADSSMRALSDKVLEDFELGMDEELQPEQKAQDQEIGIDDFLEGIDLDPGLEKETEEVSVSTQEKVQIAVDEPKAEAPPALEVPPPEAPEITRPSPATLKQPSSTSVSVEKAAIEGDTEVASLARTLGVEISEESQEVQESKTPELPSKKLGKTLGKGSQAPAQATMAMDQSTRKVLNEILSHVKEVEKSAQQRAIELQERKLELERKREEEEMAVPAWQVALRQGAFLLGCTVFIVIYLALQDSIIATTYKMNQAYKNLDDSGNRQLRIVVRETSGPTEFRPQDYFGGGEIPEIPRELLEEDEKARKREAQRVAEESENSGKSVEKVHEKKEETSKETPPEDKDKTSVQEQPDKKDEIQVAKVDEPGSEHETRPETSQVETKKEPVKIVKKPVKQKDPHLANQAGPLASTPGGEVDLEASAPPKNGSNKYRYPNGDRYVGQFLNHKRHGEGTMFFASGEIYHGGWIEDKFNGQGIYTWPNGDKYSGSWMNGVREGEGLFSWVNGELYKGSFKNGLRHGYGKMEFANGESYTGDWKEDLFHGPGIYVFANGATYDGNFQAGVMHGKGSFKYSNGRRYSGTFINGARDGEGEISFPNGERYVGLWKEDYYHGKGAYYWPDGESYEGDFTQGRMEGEGIHIWANGDRYQGDFLKDQPHGKGILEYANEARYEGQFKHGLRDGDGVYVAANGYTYAGSWKQGMRNGLGTARFADGEGYTGNWLEDQPHGMGRYVWNEGHKYVGQFERGRRNGLGTFIWSDGQIQEGIWTRDRYVGKKVASAKLSKLEQKIYLMVSEEVGQVPKKPATGGGETDQGTRSPTDPSESGDQPSKGARGAEGIVLPNK